MFEEEAEEYTLKKLVGLEDFDSYQSAYDRYENGVQDAFKEGAEFGYNKAFVEADKNLKAVVADFNKANEWHYVKDGDLPKENQLVLLYRENPNGANVALTYWYKSYVKDKVIAWKEIVLPKEIE